MNIIKNDKQPTYMRQRYLLGFYSQMKGERLQSTNTQKLIFLHQKKHGLSYYDFIPYKYGPYSFQLNEDIQVLIRDGYLMQDDGAYYTPYSFAFDYPSDFAVERGNSLIRKTYNQYPYYAINSEIISRLYEQKDIDKFISYKSELVKTSSELFTVGYEGRTLESFLNLLIINNIRLLCDVRRNPLSRKFGFSRKNLEHILPSIGIKYIHIPELGIESSKRSDLTTPSDYNILFKYYEEFINNNDKLIDDLYRLYDSNKRIALMCFERDVNYCHRHVIRDNIKQKYNITGVDL